MYDHYDTAPRRPSRLAFDVSRIVIDLGALLVLAAMSLPFVTAEGFHQRSLAGDGLVALLLVAPVFVMTVLPDQSRPLPRPLAWVSLGLAGVALPYAVLKYLDASTLAGRLQGSVGMGVRVLVVGASLVLAGLVFGMVRAHFRPAEAAPEPDPAQAPAARPRAASTRVPAPAPTRAPLSGRSAAGPDPAARPFPRLKPPGWASRRETREAPGPPAPGPGTAGPARPAPRRAPAPRPADPDTEPTVPAQRPVQPWWPEHLDDLFR